MAESSPSESLVDDFLTCKICFDIYKEPKILPCLHTFCLKCITGLLKGDQLKLTCPICRDESEISGTEISHFKTNIYVRNLTEVFKTKNSKSESPKCSFCHTKGLEREATSLCLDCQDDLCHECASYHNFTRITLNHTVASLKDINAGDYDSKMRSMQVVLCSVHSNEAIRFFCETCNTPVCGDCILLTHKLHNCISAEEAVKSFTEKMYLLSKDLEQKLCSNLEVTGCLQKYLNDIENKEKNIISAINSSTAEIIERVNCESMEVQGIVHRTFLHPKKEIKKLLEESSHFTDGIKESMRCCNDAVQNCKSVELLYLYDDLNNRLLRLKDRRCTPHVKNTFTVPKVGVNNNYSKQRIFEISQSAEKIHFSVPSQTQIKSTNKLVDKPLRDSRFVLDVNKIHNPTFTFIRKIRKKKAIWEPKLTSCTWINNTQFAVVDSENQTIERFDLAHIQDLNVTSESTKLQFPFTIISYENKLICGSYRSIYKIDNSGDIISVKFNSGFTSGPIVLAQGKTHYFVGGIEAGKIIVYSGNEEKRKIIVKNEESKQVKFDPFSMNTNSKDEVIMFDKLTNSILVIGVDGRIKKRIEKFSKYYLSPGSLCVDKLDNIFLADHINNYILIFSAEGKTLTTLSLEPHIYRPRSISISEDGRLLITASNGYIGIFKIDYI